MKTQFAPVAALCASLFVLMAVTDRAADVAAENEPHQPHTPTLIFYLSGADGQKDTDAIRSSVQKLKGAALLEVNTARSYARIRFDSHVVSYHQVAQAIVDAGTALGKNYDPYLIFCVSEYSSADNAAKVDAVFAGKRLNMRVNIKPLDKKKGMFAVHFLPLKIDSEITAPQGFNGGHLHHPISDPPPRGLGLVSTYAANDE